MNDISVIICTHNPRPNYLLRVLAALRSQTLPMDQWELVLIDNASREPLADKWDLSWHPRGRIIREEEIGITPARLRGISETTGNLLIFVDDDNVLVEDYLKHAVAIAGAFPHVGVFGAGILEPEFEVKPEPLVSKRQHMLALRKVPRAFWTNNPNDYHCGPFGAGMCVPRAIAGRFVELVHNLEISTVLGRRGGSLFSHEDDLFYWLSAGNEAGFGIFPELRITHLIPASRVQPDYIVRLIHNHSFSKVVLSYKIGGKTPPKTMDFVMLRVIAHGLKNGWFSMRCFFAEVRGAEDAVRFIREKGLRALPREKVPFSHLAEAKLGEKVPAVPARH